MTWAIIATLVLILAVGGLIVWRERKKGRAWGEALQAGAEKVIALLAQNGQIENANKAGQIIKRELDNRGPAVKLLNDTVFKVTKAKLKAGGLDVRALIGEAERVAKGNR